MSKIQKQIAIIVCVCFVAVSIFSIVYIASHADHECPEVHCEICLQITYLQNTLKQFCAAVFAMAVTMSTIYVIAAIVEAVKPNRIRTLISLKVQLNN